MAGDKKGKGKQVVQQRKKHTREDRERERAEAVADAADRQGSLRIRDPQAQGESQQHLRRSGRTRQPETTQTTPESRSLLALLKYPLYLLFILDNGMNLISKSLTVLTPA